LQSNFENWQRDPKSVPASLFELLVFYSYLNEDYNKLFFLLNKTKNLEQYALLLL
jgi:hypothetical protein